MVSSHIEGEKMHLDMEVGVVGNLRHLYQAQLHWNEFHITRKYIVSLF